MDPNTGYPAGYPVPTQSPQNQQMSFYPNAVPPYPQSKTPSAQHFGAMPMQPGPGGAMMPSGFQQASAAPMDSFSAPYTQTPIPTLMGQFVPAQGTSGANMPSQVAQTFSQNMASISANNLLGTQPKPPSQMNSPQTGASPAVPNQAQAQAQAQAQFAAREKARVTALLDINSALLQEVVNLQAAGKAGPASNPDTNSPSSEQLDASKAHQKPSPEYIECMRRLQANLAYLATIADRAKKAGGVVPQTPAIMTPPPNLPTVNELYARLNELFSRSAKASTSQRPSPPSMQGNGGPSPGAMAESII
ncbi:pro-apoptotic serine protease nma111 [Penicillium digitatum]|nr:pro-apoptotic serine protease nma111 [Penicillium digitatum]